ncbi:MAG: c-type cytochrome [Polyangiales bacterium]
MSAGRVAGALLLAALALVGCGDTVRYAPLAERGAALARDPAVTRSQYNRVACTTCHAERPGDGAGRVLPGAVLAGAARRSSFWGGEVLHLEEAVARCWVYFMRGVPADLDGPTGAALAAWLESLADVDGAVTTPVPFTVPRTVRDLPDGDAARGRQVFVRACQSCHGALGSGAGRLGPLVAVLPGDTLTEHCRGMPPIGVPDLPTYTRMAVVQKTRHGGFLGYGGTMPPFSLERLTDQEVADLVALFPCMPRE